MKAYQKLAIAALLIASVALGGCVTTGTGDLIPATDGPGFIILPRVTDIQVSDFSINGNGSCTIVVGDATGHGLHAGMVVGAAKSLFQTSSHEDELSRVMAKIESGLGAMHRREASMAMLLLRLQAHRIDLASAGMPPMLVWRHQTGSVEEIMLPSVPLGTLARTEYGKASVDLQAGDTVLVMTDGLAEVCNPEGDLLGYDRAADLFQQVAHLEPDDAIHQLLEMAAAFHEGTPLQDDMTLVVLKAQG